MGGRKLLNRRYSNEHAFVLLCIILMRIGGGRRGFVHSHYPQLYTGKEAVIGV
jgi:hypothetical protein